MKDQKCELLDDITPPIGDKPLLQSLSEKYEDEAYDPYATVCVQAIDTLERRSNSLLDVLASRNAMQEDTTTVNKDIVEVEAQLKIANMFYNVYKDLKALNR